MTSVLRRRNEEANITEGKPGEDIGRKWSYIILRERPEKKPNLLTPRSWISSLLKHKKRNICFLGHLVCASSLWQPRK